MILFSCMNNNENNVSIDNVTTEKLDTLLQIPTDENGNHGVYIRNHYTIYTRKNNPGYGNYMTNCAVDEYTYSNGFKKYMLRFNFRSYYTDTGFQFVRLNFTEEEFPYLSEFLDSCINYKKDERENVSKSIEYSPMIGAGFLHYNKEDDLLYYDRNDNTAMDNFYYCFDIELIELKNIVAGGKEKIAELRRDNEKIQQADTLSQKQ